MEDGFDTELDEGITAEVDKGINAEDEANGVELLVAPKPAAVEVEPHSDVADDDDAVGGFEAAELVDADEDPVEE